MTVTYRYRSWQAAGQYRFMEGAGRWPALALRVAAWGNDARATETTTPIRVAGAILNTVTVSRPADRQLQADLIGTWAVAPGLELSAVAGAGRTRLSCGALAATTTRNGCLYDLRFTGNDILGTPHLSALLRAQINSKLFFNDVPVTYNSSTSASFGSRLSLFTLALRADF